MPHNIQIRKFAKFTWLTINQPNPRSILWLKDQYHFDQAALEEIISPATRSLVYKYPDYALLTLIFPVINPDTKSIEPSEIDCFLGSDYLITIHHGQLAPLNAMNDLKICEDSSETFLSQILKKLYLSYFPILDQFDSELTEIEQKIFSGQERRITEKLMITRRDITDIRKIMQAHQFTLEKLVRDDRAEKLYTLTAKNKIYYHDLIAFAKEIWEQLANYKEAIETFSATNESIISFKLNAVIKILTTISVTILPASLIAAFFGMNAAQMPLINHSLGFPIMISISLTASMVTLIILWHKKWL